MAKSDVERRLGRAFTEEEQKAVRWAKSNYRGWKKRFSGSFEEDMKDVLAGVKHHIGGSTYRGIPLQNWAYWYFAPFGIPEWNEHVTLLRAVFSEIRRREGVPPSFSGPE